jgi:cytochrome c oxidase subunit 4
MEQKEEPVHIVSYKTLVYVWLGLLALTAVTITVTEMHLGKLSTFTALLIASAKAGLVLYFFMHLKYERRLLKLMLFMPIVTLTIIIGLTFFDIRYR